MKNEISKVNHSTKEMTINKKKKNPAHLHRQKQKYSRFRILTIQKIYKC